jgi:acyl-CoA thioester hydrolase
VNRVSAGLSEAASSAPSKGSATRGTDGPTPGRSPECASNGPQAWGDGRIFTFAIRVYYEDTDAAGVVYYANYLRYMERARTEWLEALGFPLAAFEREHDVAFAVHRAEIDFLAPARLNDRLAVSVEVRERGASRLVVAQQVLRDGTALVNGLIVLACVDPRRWRAARIPAPLARALPPVAPAGRHRAAHSHKALHA